MQAKGFHIFGNILKTPLLRNQLLSEIVTSALFITVYRSSSCIYHFLHVTFDTNISQLDSVVLKGDAGPSECILHFRSSKEQDNNLSIDYITHLDISEQ